MVSILGKHWHLNSTKKVSSGDNLLASAKNLSHALVFSLMNLKRQRNKPQRLSFTRQNQHCRHLQRQDRYHRLHFLLTTFSPTVLFSSCCVSQNGSKPGCMLGHRLSDKARDTVAAGMARARSRSRAAKCILGASSEREER